MARVVTVTMSETATDGVMVCAARLRVTSAGHLTSDVRLQSDVTGYYLCFSRRGRPVVKVAGHFLITQVDVSESDC